MKITVWPSPAKINLFLYINNRRIDGYHNLQTLFQFLNYGDTIHISLNQSDKIILLSSLSGVLDKNNLILNAAKQIKKIAQKRFITNKKYGANIFIDKYIPIGSGLGGGSSNAATILMALNHLWNVGLTLDELSLIGLQLGADIPIFIKGFSAFAEGIGEIIKKVHLDEKWYLIVYPNINISTFSIFNHKNLQRSTPVFSLHTLLKNPFFNDCENVVRKKFKKIDEIINYLSCYAPTRLTGTGSCVFSEFDSEIKAKAMCKKIPTGFYRFIAKSCNTSLLNIFISQKQHKKYLNFFNKKNNSCSLFNQQY